MIVSKPKSEALASPGAQGADAWMATSECRRLLDRLTVLNVPAPTLAQLMAEIFIAHRKFVERRFPDCAGLAWACSLEEIDWRSRGFDGSGRALGWLLSQAGYFHDAHRASGDVDAVLQILQHRFADDTTALAELLANAEKPIWMISAVGAHFDVKDRLKNWGYRWNGDESVWFRQVSDALRDAELIWLDLNVYAPILRPRTDRPAIREMTRFTRYA